MSATRIDKKITKYRVQKPNDGHGDKSSGALETRGKDGHPGHQGEP